jgi:hypothetical protein
MLSRVPGLSTADRKFLVDASLLTAAVMWEGFLHELFVVYINREPSRLGRALETAITQSVQDKRGGAVSTHVRLDWPKHLTRATVIEILDRDDRNVSFKTAADMVQGAAEWLGTKHANKFKALTNGDRAAIDAWRSVRNYPAHRSSSSKKEMDSALAAQALGAGLRRGRHKISDVGAHFDAALREVPVSAGSRWSWI